MSAATSRIGPDRGPVKVHLLTMRKEKRRKRKASVSNVHEYVVVGALREFGFPARRSVEAQGKSR